MKKKISDWPEKIVIVNCSTVKDHFSTGELSENTYAS